MKFGPCTVTKSVKTTDVDEADVILRVGESVQVAASTSDPRDIKLIVNSTGKKHYIPMNRFIKDVDPNLS